MPPAPLPAAASLEAHQEFLVEMFRYVADAEVYGVLWLDAGLRVTGTFGPLVSFVASGRPVTESIVPFIGLEDDFRALQAEQGRILELPAVAVKAGGITTPRLNFSVFWIAHRALYLVLVYRSAAQSEIETELSKQIRARLMAEAEVTRKSKELAETNAELARANSDLEAYASIIAHDLKSPLRAMRYLTEDIEAALESGNNAGAKSKFDALKLQSRRMSSMMAALFDYSSIGRKQDTIEGVDTGALVGDICGSLHVPAGMKILISGEWPAVRTSKAPLDLVLRNLVDNAIKHHDRSSGTVEVHASNEGQSLAISIKDDGPGIPPHLHDAVFLPFRKGVKSDQMGHGMGLALVKKTVELQGGRIEVHSDPEKRVGTEFRVVWPIAPASASDRNENS